MCVRVCVRVCACVCTCVCVHLHVCYYTSPRLFSDLHDNGFGACGTVRINRRGLPAALKENVRKGEMKVIQMDNSMLAIKWMDKHAVTTLTMCLYRKELTLKECICGVRPRGAPVALNLWISGDSHNNDQGKKLPQDDMVYSGIGGTSCSISPSLLFRFSSLLSKSSSLLLLSSLLPSSSLLLSICLRFNHLSKSSSLTVLHPLHNFIHC